MDAGSATLDAMAKTDPVLARMRAICLALPDTKETLTWGEPHFRVGEKIFAGYGGHKGKMTIGFKLTKPHAEAVIHDPRFERAPYVGKHGWVSMDASKVTDWGQVAAMIHESYELIAPKASPLRPKRPSAAPKASPRKAKTPSKRKRSG
jgi:predicted DNA-binding protein (MmcQ/YjbR family)